MTPPKAGRNANVSSTWENNLALSLKTKHATTTWPRDCIPGHSPPCTRVCTSFVHQSPQTGNHPDIAHQDHPVACPHQVHYLAMTGNKCGTLQRIMPKGQRQSKRVTSCPIPFMRRSRKDDSVEMENSHGWQKVGVREGRAPSSGDAVFISMAAPCCALEDIIIGETEEMVWGVSLHYFLQLYANLQLSPKETFIFRKKINNQLQFIFFNSRNRAPDSRTC